jgi:hypothetical protein
LGSWTIHEEVFEDKVAFAALEWAAATAAYDLAIWRRPCLGANELVFSAAIWAVETRRGHGEIIPVL